LTHAWIGAVYYWQFDYSNAGQVYKDAIRIYETHKVSDINYAAALNNLGRTYYWSKNYPLAIENLEKSLALF
jgi:tetratricopeptide (TPR) repeat protein